jgi:hypothetical protein
VPAAWADKSGDLLDPDVALIETKPSTINQRASRVSPPHEGFSCSAFDRPRHSLIDARVRC